MIRILGGKNEHYSVSNLQAVLSALGMKMDLSAISAKRFKDTIATQKAQRLIAFTQGNVALDPKPSQQLLPAKNQTLVDVAGHNRRSRITPFSCALTRV
ncbi:MAG: hypothetical protein ACK5OC_04830 [Pirellula sp.]